MKTIALWAIWFMIGAVGCDLHDAIRAQTKAIQQATEVCK